MEFRGLADERSTVNLGKCIESPSTSGDVTEYIPQNNYTVMKERWLKRKESGEHTLKKKCHNESRTRDTSRLSSSGDCIVMVCVLTVHLPPQDLSQVETRPLSIERH